MLAVLSGGSGSAKLVRGLRQLGDFTLIVNVGDNYWFHGLYVCPDLDILMYELAGLLDRARGWGIRDDTFSALSQLQYYGLETWFRLGDRDLATCLARTYLLSRGETLTQVTAKLSGALGIAQRLLPASDEYVPTLLDTDQGLLHLQEFWVKRRGQPRVRRVIYGSEGRPASSEALEALRRAEAIIIPPANPVTSIAPILALSGMAEAMRGKPVVAVSPFRGGEAFSGPAAKLLRELGLEVSPLTLLQLYKGLVTHLLIDSSDERLLPELQSRGIRAWATDLSMETEQASARVAGLCLQVLGEL